MQLKVTKRNYGLDVIRSFAILMVVASHCTYFLVDDSKNTIILIIRILGAVGVDLFFLLSGFLIGGILLKLMENNQTQFSDLIIFWKRRWFRTLPNYFLILILNIIIVLILGEYLPKDILLFFPFLQNFSSAHPDFFTEAWSLSIEEYAYLILPLIFYGLLYFFRGLRAKQVFLWGTIGVISILFLIKFRFYAQQSITSYSDWSLTFRKVVLYRLDAIYLGFLLIYLVRQHTDFFKKWKIMMLFLGTVIFTATHYLIYEFQILPETHLWLRVSLFGLDFYMLCIVFSFCHSFKEYKAFR